MPRRLAAGLVVLLAPSICGAVQLPEAAAPVKATLLRREESREHQRFVDPFPGVSVLQMDPPRAERQQAASEMHSSALDVGSRMLARDTSVEELDRIRIQEHITPTQSFTMVMSKGICASGMDEKTGSKPTSTVKQCSEMCWADMACRFFGYNQVTQECVTLQTRTCEKDVKVQWPLFATYEAQWSLNGKMQPRERCDYSEAACQTALAKQDLKISGGGFPFASEYKTTGCFYYYAGSLVRMGFYGTRSGGIDIISKAQMTSLDTEHEQIARPWAYPSCHSAGDKTPGCIALGTITKDLVKNTGCEWGGMEWVNVTTSMNLKQHTTSLEANWAKMSATWTSDQKAHYLSTVRPGHRHECQRVCRLQVYQRGKLCCYFNPADGLGCFIKPQAEVSVEGTGYSASCDFGMGNTE